MLGLSTDSSFLTLCISSVLLKTHLLSCSRASMLVFKASRVAR